MERKKERPLSNMSPAGFHSAAEGCVFKEARAQAPAGAVTASAPPCCSILSDFLCFSLHTRLAALPPQSTARGLEKVPERMLQTQVRTAVSSCRWNHWGGPVEGLRVCARPVLLRPQGTERPPSLPGTARGRGLGC